MVTVVMKFYFQASETFVLEYMSVDGVSQNDYGVAEVLDSIYESYDAE